MRFQRKIRHGVQIAIATGESLDESLGEPARKAAADDFATLREVLPERFDLGRPLVLDISAVPFVNSAGLNAIDHCVKIARRRGGLLAVAGAVPKVREVFRIVKLDKAALVFDTVAEALDKLVPNAEERERLNDWGKAGLPPSAEPAADPKAPPETSKAEEPPGPAAPAELSEEALEHWAEALRLYARLREIADARGVPIEKETTFEEFFFRLAGSMAPPRASHRHGPADGDMARELKKLHLKLNELKTGSTALKLKLEAANADLTSLKNDMRIVKISTQR